MENSREFPTFQHDKQTTNHLLFIFKIITCERFQDYQNPMWSTCRIISSKCVAKSGRVTPN